MQIFYAHFQPWTQAGELAQHYTIQYTNLRISYRCRRLLAAQWGHVIIIVSSEVECTKPPNWVVLCIMLQLPHMNKIIVAFDVDGTLITNTAENRQHGVVNSSDEPIEEMIQMLKTLSRFKNVKIVVWSGGGSQYARLWVERLGITKYVWQTASKEDIAELRRLVYPIIAIDDMHACELGDLNLIVRNK